METVLQTISSGKHDDELKPIKLMLVDDHEIARNGLKMIFQNSQEIEVVGEAANCEDALSQLKEIAPDIILLDVKMPDKDGFVTMNEIRKLGCKSPILLISGYNYEIYAQDAMESESSGFITKDRSRDFILNAVKLVVKGGIVWEKEVFRKALDNIAVKREMLTNVQMLENDTPLLVELLSPREQQVLQLVAGGSANKEICHTLSLSEVSVKKLVANIMHKLRVKNRTQAALVANRYKLKEI